jgi:sugar phosphate isomerase/epimerase
MLIGCGEWGFRNLPMRDHFRIANKFGFKLLEFGIGGGQPGRLPEHPTPAQIEEFIELGREHGIRTPFCCIENDFTLAPAAHQAMLARVLTQIRVAAGCGATHVRLFAGFTPATAMTEEIWQRMLHAFGVCDALCEQLNLLIAIETHGAIRHTPAGLAIHTSSVTTDRDGIARLLKELPPRVGFNYDPGNIKAACPDDRRLALNLLNGRINYCHLKDWRALPADGQTGWLPCAIGDDDLDYAALLPRMKFDGCYLIEYEPLEDTEAGIGRSVEFLRKCGFPIRYE